MNPQAWKVLTLWLVAAVSATANPMAKAAATTAELQAKASIDTQAATSADGQQTVFVRQLSGPSPASELWWSRAPGQPPKRLLQESIHSDPKRTLAGFNNPVFSADGQSVYVMTQAWATSNAIHRIDLRTGRTRFVAAGNSVQVVPRGRWAGHLVVMQHKYAPGGGALDPYWLLTPTGREVRRVGGNEAEAAAFMAAAQASR